MIFLSLERLCLINNTFDYLNIPINSAVNHFFAFHVLLRYI